MVPLFKNIIYCDNTSYINKCIHSRDFMEFVSTPMPSSTVTGTF